MTISIQYVPQEEARAEKRIRLRRMLRRGALVICTLILLELLARQYILPNIRVPVFISLASGYVTFEVFLYLQTDRKNFLNFASTLAAREAESLHKQSVTDDKYQLISRELNSLNEKVSALQAGGKDEIDSLISTVSDAALKSVSQDILMRVERKVEELSDLYSSRHALEMSAISRNRLEISLDRLSRRGNTNLAIGTFVTITGASMLWYFVVFESIDAGNAASYIMHFIPRISIVILVQVFALFFLKLYKSGIDDIKYIENEITNIEQKELALSVSLLQDDSDLRAKIILHIAQTERNNVLKNGESTIQLERDKLAYQTDYFASVAKIVTSISSLKK